ncbi:hypothetical protein FOCC_FOCC007736 [Frankliniella occidentalis]|nr:hypothetical protein FOCC_FOCC007736 [Frankliniella occidentalis]
MDTHLRSSYGQLCVGQGADGYIQTFALNQRPTNTSTRGPRRTPSSFVIRTMTTIAQAERGCTTAVVGRLGPFQVANCLFINMPVLFTAIYTITFVFTAQELNYRCLVPECETADTASYAPPWLPEAVPVHNDTPEACVRFVYNNSSSGGNSTCSADLFDTTRTERCGAWVYEPGQRSTILDEVRSFWDLTCDDNKWKLALVGSIGYIGGFVFKPLVGLLSDRFGRKRLLASTYVLASLCGIAKSFSADFITYLLFQFLGSIGDGSVSAAAFLLAVEFVGPQQRVLISTLVSVFYSGGNALMGALAWAVRDWRWLLRAVHAGGLVFAIPLWFVPESVRWLAARGRLDEANAIVAKVAAINKVAVREPLRSTAGKVSVRSAGTVKCQFPPTYFGILRGRDNTCYRARGCLVQDGESVEMASALDTLIRLFGSRTLSLRFANCCYCWMANCFVYFGLLLNTVTLSGDQYVNFILSGLLEVPANLLVLWLQDYAGRRWPVAGALPVLSVALYMLGRFAVTISFNVIYVISAEMFPTNIRSSMLNICSSFGTVGLVLAPQTPLLATVSESLPLTLFGVVSLSSGLLALLFPETTGRPLPETLDEAESLGAAVDRAAQRPGGGATGSRPRARKNTSMDCGAIETETVAVARNFNPGSNLQEDAKRIHHDQQVRRLSAARCCCGCARVPRG